MLDNTAFSLKQMPGLNERIRGVSDSRLTPRKKKQKNKESSTMIVIRNARKNQDR